MGSYQVKLLEINAEPAIELTGPRLSWILEDLFVSIGKICVEPFVTAKQEPENDDWKLGDVRFHLIKCLEQAVRF
jgi:tubulin--tyrosine ligase